MSRGVSPRRPTASCRATEWCTSRSRRSKVSLAGPGTHRQHGKRQLNGPSASPILPCRPPGAPDPRLYHLPLLRPQGSSHPGSASWNHMGSVAGGGAGPRHCTQVLLRVTLHSDVNSARVFWGVHTVGLQGVPRQETEAEPQDPERTVRAEWAFLSAPLRAQDRGAGEGRGHRRRQTKSYGLFKV